MRTVGIWLCLLSLLVSLGGAVPKEKETQVYFHPEDGKFYHAVPDCASVSERYHPITPIPLDKLNTRPFLRLTRCTVCGAPERPPMETETDAGESDLRTLNFAYDDDGLLFLGITMNGTGQEFIHTDLPRGCYLDTYHDGNAILMDYDPMVSQDEQDSGSYRDQWFMTFEYVRDDWRLTHITNGQDWEADVENGVYTFDDVYEHDSKWQWNVKMEDRLLLYNFRAMARMIKVYNIAMSERPGLRPIETE